MKMQTSVLKEKSNRGLEKGNEFDAEDIPLAEKK